MDNTDQPKPTMSSVMKALTTSHTFFQDTVSGKRYIITPSGLCMGFNDNVKAIIAEYFYKTHNSAVKFGDSVRYALASHAATHQKTTYLRTASIDGNVFYKLNQTQVVKITSDGWDVIPRSDAGVIFRESRGTGAQVTPAPTDQSLYDLLNIFGLTDHERILLAGVLVSAMFEAVDHPILDISGPQGSGKSMLSGFIKRIIDPNGGSGLTTQRSDMHDIALALSDSTVFVYENKSFIKQDISDMLAACSTNGDYITRELYTTEQMVTLQLRATQIVNGIVDVLTNADVLDRTIKIVIDRRSDFGSKLATNERFEDALPELLGAVLNAVSNTIRSIDEYKDVKCSIRMSDMYRITLATADTCGVSHAEVLNAFQINTQMNTAKAIENSQVAEWIIENVADMPFVGKVSDIFNLIKTDNPHCTYKAANSVGRDLKRVKTDLAAIGYHISDKDRDNLITITKTDQAGLS